MWVNVKEAGGACGVFSFAIAVIYCPADLSCEVTLDCLTNHSVVFSYKPKIYQSLKEVNAVSIDFFCCCFASQVVPQKLPTLCYNLPGYILVKKPNTLNELKLVMTK